MSRGIAFGVVLATLIVAGRCDDSQKKRCPPCIPDAGCKLDLCDCKLADGTLMTPPNRPSQPPRPPGCNPCPPVECPPSNIDCAAPSLCCPEQRKTYVPLCPPCDIKYACPQNKCPCRKCDGTVLVPPHAPPRDSRCEPCDFMCTMSVVVCPKDLDSCTPDQVRDYVSCPECNTHIDCPPMRCNCKTRNGTVLTPPLVPTPPPRPLGCPSCDCPQQMCSAELAECTPEQLHTYLYCRPCSIATDCHMHQCDCQKKDGTIMTPATTTPPPPRPAGCPGCFCPLYIIECPEVLAQCTPQQLCSYVPKCSPCLIANCPKPGCPCTRCDGAILIPPPPPSTTPRPSDCKKCVCPLMLIKCVDPPPTCSPNQLSTYHLKCDECSIQLDCRNIRCPCRRWDNIIMVPSNIIRFRPKDCPACNCPQIRCIYPELDCDETQLEHYIECPRCVPNAGCRRPGCPCSAPDGTLMVPRSYPPQPSRPANCPTCPEVQCTVQLCKRVAACTQEEMLRYVPDCPECPLVVGVCDCRASNGSVLRPPSPPPRPTGCKPCNTICDICPKEPDQCTADQEEQYILKCPECNRQAGCREMGCNCIACDGTEMQPPMIPAQPPMPIGCPECRQYCPIPFVPCPYPTTRKCTKDQDHYVPVVDCSDCIPNAGCRRPGCPCRAPDGTIMVPRSYPPQPPRPDSCPACPKVKCIVEMCLWVAPCTKEEMIRFVPDCPTCPSAGVCDCRASNGSILSPPPIPPRPIGCKPCIQIREMCPIEPNQCTVDQEEQYILKCPECNPQAGCREMGCNCLALDGTEMQPPMIPAQPPMPIGCPECRQYCPIPFVPCPYPTTRMCTKDQMNHYEPVVDCIDCIPDAGCKLDLCDCKLADGTLMTPPNKPPQPPRPPCCDPCPPVECPPSGIRCAAPALCTCEQERTYVPVCPKCDPKYACPQTKCPCKTDDGEVLIPPIAPPRHPKCPPCVYMCPMIIVYCPPKPTAICTAKQLDEYDSCPICNPQAGCREMGCNCYGPDGIEMQPPMIPEDPPVPKGCPECRQYCPIPFIPCGKPIACSKVQLKRYIPRCAKCIPDAGCKLDKCDCKLANGTLMTPPNRPAQPPRDSDCPPCPRVVCPPSRIRCAAPTLCTCDEERTYVPVKCPPCTTADCPTPGCPCTRCDGAILIPRQQSIKPRPPKCPVCLCPKILIKCVAPPPKCTADQLKGYIVKCDPCIQYAGCRAPGCECTASDGTRMVPPTNPPQPPRPVGCAACDTSCPVQTKMCINPATQCTNEQMKIYVPKCELCIPDAGCKLDQCDCKLANGTLMTPPNRPEQPPRADGCDPCPVVVCPPSRIRCAAPTLCTCKQESTYVPLCPPCDRKYACPNTKCPCKKSDGTTLIPPIAPPRDPRCSPCLFPCPRILVQCPSDPDECSPGQLIDYVACPECNSQAGCKEIGCNCFAPDGSEMEPPTIPAQPPVPKGCPPCVRNCPMVKCAPPGQCSPDQRRRYVRKPCPKCVPNAGCDRPGCKCMFGRIPMYPGTYPPQPKRPAHCSVCPKICPMWRYACPPATTKCSPEQVRTYKIILDDECGCDFATENYY